MKRSFEPRTVYFIDWMEVESKAKLVLVSFYDLCEVKTDVLFENVAPRTFTC